MTEILLWATGFVLALTMVIVYSRTRDPLHPIMYLAPMLGYIHVYIPAIYFYRDQLGDYFRDPAQLEYALTFTLAAVAAFCVGCAMPRIPPEARNIVRAPLQLSPRAAEVLKKVSYVLAAIGVAAYFYGLSRTGGLMEAYSRPKGGGSTASGYISSAYLLTIPALMIYLISRRSRRMDLKTGLIVLVFLSPHLLHGFLSASRGTTFLALAAMLFGWYLATSQRPSLHLTLAGFVGLGLLMLFLKTYRRDIYIGSEFDFDRSRAIEAFAPSEPTVGDTSVFSYGLILASAHHGFHYWGQRVLVQLLVRPIPRQLWPTKYEDMGMGWMVTQPGTAGISNTDWIEAVGWFPDRGSAAGIVADSFLEFGWGGLALCFLVGYLYAYLWRQALLRRGIWNLLYFEAAVVSVFVPTQSFLSAWLYRFTFLAVPTILIMLWIRRLVRKALERGHLMPRIPEKIISLVDWKS